MLEEQSYEYHIQLLEGLERNLNSLTSRVQDIDEKYQHQINSMDSAGFLNNYIDPLKERYALFQSKISRLQSLIDQHKSVVDRHQAKLNQLIATARS